MAIEDYRPEDFYREVVAHGGGKFRGLQRSYGKAQGLVLFDDASHPRRSTLALAVPSLTTNKVREHILRQRLAYTQAEIRRLRPTILVRLQKLLGLGS
jgi:hypothetical protein